MADNTDELRQRIEDLKRELRLKDERILELRDEVDKGREFVNSMEAHVQERDELSRDVYHNLRSRTWR